MRLLTNSELKQLQEIFKKVFGRETLDMLLQDRLDTTLQLESADKNFLQQLREVLRNANQEGWIYELVWAAACERPNADELRATARVLGLTEKPESSLEALLNQIPPQDLPTVRRRLFELEQQVCQIRVPIGNNTVTGTGFLVGPDLVMTNYHVVEKVIKGPAGAGNIRVRFDYKTSQDGAVVFAGIEHPLAGHNPIEIHSEYHSRDLTEHALDDTWPADQLDFAILRLATGVGAQPAGPMVNDSGVVDRPQRGWLRAPAAALSFDADTRVTIVQHPMGDPIKIASGEATAWNSNLTRVRYRTNTLPGSSGSPCLNSRWEWVALHHCGDPAWAPRYNQGIPVSAIVAHLKAKARMDLLP
jgi:hypothetical protein